MQSGGQAAQNGIGDARRPTNGWQNGTTDGQQKRTHVDEAAGSGAKSDEVTGVVPYQAFDDIFEVCRVSKARE